MTKDNTKKKISIIIPAYKEGGRIIKNLQEIKEYFDKYAFDYDILVVVDGSPDNTADVARAFGKDMPNFNVIENQKNNGKGYVVRQGLLASSGDYKVFLDADGSTSISHISEAIRLLEDGIDVVVGSRAVKGAYIQVHQPWHRRIMGSGGNWLIRGVLGLWKYPDTQCGFKALQAKAAQEVASRMCIDRFGFDFELIVLAKELGFNIQQMPVRWMNEDGTTVGLFGPNGFIQVLIDLFKVRFYLLSGRYKLNNIKD